MLAPLIVSHAACKGHAPENTLAGIEAALRLGVDAIEIDVHASSDGTPVLIHDDTLERTTNGGGRVQETTLARLRTLDAAGGLFEGRFAGERIPTLAEVLDRTRDACLLVIEIKQTGIESAVATVVRRLRAAQSAMIWSFHADVVEAARVSLPEVPAARLWTGRDGDGDALLATTLRSGAQAVSVHGPALDAPLMTAARRRGLSVFTWTVDDPEEQARVAALGVAGICTNYPDVLRTTLSRQAFDLPSAQQAG